MKRIIFLFLILTAVISAQRIKISQVKGLTQLSDKLVNIADNVTITQNLDSTLSVDTTIIRTKWVNPDNAILQFSHQIYFMGNSLTQSAVKDTDNVYPNKVGLLLGNSWNVNNKGIGGNTTAQMLARFNTDIIDNGDAEYVVILGGINDIGLDIDATTIEANLQAMYTAAHNDSIKVVAVTILPRTNYSAARYAIMDSVNTWIKESAINVDYIVDAFSVFENPVGTHTLDTTYSDGGNVHLSRAGYELLGTTVYNNVTWTPRYNYYPKISIAGQGAKIDQDVSSYGDPTFNSITIRSMLNADVAYFGGNVVIGGSVTALTGIFSNDIRPDVNLSNNLGTGSYYWNNGYINHIYTYGITTYGAITADALSVSNSFFPSVNLGADIGSGGAYFNKGYIWNLYSNTSTVTSLNVTSGSFSNDASPSANLGANLGTGSYYWNNSYIWTMNANSVNASLVSAALLKQTTVTIDSTLVNSGEFYILSDGTVKRKF